MSDASPVRAALAGLRRYIDRAATLGGYWKVPTPVVLYRMLAARLFFGRSPDEFDTKGFARKPIAAWREYVRTDELRAWQTRVALEPALRYHKDKLLFARHCVAHQLPTPAPLGVLSGTAVDDPLTIESAGALAGLFAAHGDLDGFAKPLMGLSGYGAFAFTVRAGELQPRPRCASPEDLYAQCTQGRFAEGGYLLQERIHPHPELLAIMPGPGLGTIRIKSFLRRDGSVSFGMPILKVPAPGAEVDNTRRGSLMAAVDLETGVIQSAIGAFDIGGGRTVSAEIERHRETGAVFRGRQLPCWPDVRVLVERAARAFPMLPALGWDIAISSAGPTLIETNWFFAAGFEETVSGRGWRAHYRDLYDTLAAPVMPDSFGR